MQLAQHRQSVQRLPEGATPTSIGDKLMPHFYATQLPLGFGGLILANFLCDAMQTLVSGVNSIAAVATQDVLQHSSLAQGGTASRLRVARRPFGRPVPPTVQPFRHVRSS